MGLKKWLLSFVAALALAGSAKEANAEPQIDPAVRLNLRQDVRDADLSLDSMVSLYSFLGRVPELAAVAGARALHETNHPEILRLAYFTLVNTALNRLESAISTGAHEMGHIHALKQRRPALHTGDKELSPTFLNSLVVGFNYTFNGQEPSTSFSYYRSLDNKILADVAGFNMECRLLDELAEPILKGEGTVFAIGSYLNLGLGVVLYDPKNRDITDYVAGLKQKDIAVSEELVTYLTLARFASGSFISTLTSIPNFLKTGDPSVTPISFNYKDTLFYLPEFIVRYSSEGPTIGVIGRVEKGPINLDLGIEALVAKRRIFEFSVNAEFGAGSFTVNGEAHLNTSGGYITSGSVGYTAFDQGPIAFTVGAYGEVAGGMTFEREATQKPSSSLGAMAEIKLKVP